MPEQEQVNTEKTERTKRPKSIRWQRRQERLARIRETKREERVRVHPRDDVIRRDIRHGVSRQAFPKQGTVEWPLDNFTKRRLRDGTVRLESAHEKKERIEQRERDRRGGEQRNKEQPNGNQQRGQRQPTPEAAPATS